MIEFTNVTKRYANNIGLDDVSVSINEGDFVFLVGPSGAGKSTFIKLILKEIDADEGNIKVKDREVTTMSSRNIPAHRRNIGIVFQDFRLLPHKTVFENVAFAMEITHQKRKAINKNVPQALSLMGIASYANKYPNELSAGEQQRVAIARAIVNKPALLIADEPTGNLDPVTAWEIMKLLESINKRGTTIVMVTHAKDIVDRMKKRVIVIEHGKIIRDEFGAYGMRSAAKAPKKVKRPARPEDELDINVAEIAAKRAEMAKEQIPTTPPSEPEEPAIADTQKMKQVIDTDPTDLMSDYEAAHTEEINRQEEEKARKAKDAALAYYMQDAPEDEDDPFSEESLERRARLREARRSATEYLEATDEMDSKMKSFEALLGEMAGYAGMTEREEDSFDEAERLLKDD